MLRHLLTQRASILDEVDASQDQYNDDVRTYTDTTGKLWPCRIDTTKELEYEVDRDTRKTIFKMFLVPEAQGHINAKSRVAVADVTYEVWGEPSVMRRRNRTDHLECKLRIIEG